MYGWSLVGMNRISISTRLAASKSLRVTHELTAVHLGFNKLMSKSFFSCTLNHEPLHSVMRGLRYTRKVKFSSASLSTTPRRRMGKWGYSSTHSESRHQMEVSSQLQLQLRFTPREQAAGTHWTGGWVGPRVVLDAVVNRKIPSPRRESNPRTHRYTD